MKKSEKAAERRAKEAEKNPPRAKLLNAYADGHHRFGVDPSGTKGKAYKLPSAFALALGSGRGELVSLASRPVKDGTLVLDVDIQCEIIRLVGDLISDISTLEFKVRETKSLVADLMDAHDRVRESRVKYDEIFHELAKFALATVEDSR